MAAGSSADAARRALFIHDEFTVVGGGERLLLRLSRLSQPFVRPSLVLLFQGSRPLDAQLRTRHQQLLGEHFDRTFQFKAPRPIGVRHLVGHWATRRRLRAVVDELQPRACVAFSYPAAARLALAGVWRQIPLVWVCQEDVTALLNRRVPWRTKLIVNALRRAHLHIVCLSETALAQFQQMQFPTDRLHLIPNAPDLPSDATELRCLSRAEAQPGSLVAICVAHLNPLKRHDLLLQAVGRANAAGTHVTLLCVGSVLPEHAEYAQWLRQMTAELKLNDRVTWAGEQHNVYEWLGRADVAVLASDHEAAPTFLLEASAAGLALVGSDVAGIRGVIAPGETGELFTAGDSDACAAVLVRLANDPHRRQALGAAARQRVLADQGRLERQWNDLLRALDVESRL